MLHFDKIRRLFIGGSDALSLWAPINRHCCDYEQEKRGEVAPEELSNNLIVQLGNVTEELNRRWLQNQQRSRVVVDVRSDLRHPVTTLDGSDA